MSTTANPFAPTASATPPRGDLEPVPFDFAAVLVRSAELASQHLGPVALVLVAQFLLAMGFMLADVLFDVVGQLAGSTVAVLVMLVRWGLALIEHLVTLFLSLGAARLFLAMARGEPVPLALLVGQGRSLPAALLAEAMLSLAALVVWSPTLLVGGIVALGYLPSLVFPAVAFPNGLVFLVPALVLGLGLQFFPLVVVDRGAGPVEALRRSWALTQGHKLTLLLFALGFGAVALVVSCVTFGLGYFLMLPVLTLVQVVMYDALVAEER